MRFHSELGRSGEVYAVQLLTTNGYKVLDRNFSSKFGEIDIIATQSDILVFVEVKTRSSRIHGLPEEAVTPAKLAKIRMVADYYLLTHPTKLKKYRIDVVAIEVYDGKVISAKIIKVT